MSKLRSIAADKQELDEINSRLAKNGVAGTASSEEKLRSLWRLYQQAEADVKSATDSMDQLQKKQAEEMKEVELYVENVRKLAEERESLTQEFEAENEQLTRENEQLMMEKERVNKEIQQMLQQEGFTDLAKGTASEAIAYFLVERTRLSGDVAAARRKSLTDETVKTKSEQEQKSLLSKLELQKERLEQESRQQIQRVKELELEARMLKGRLEKEKETHLKEVERVQKKADEKLKSTSSGDQESAQLREAKRKLDQELSTMKYRLKTSEEEKEKVDQKVRELTESLEAERKRRSSYEGTIIKLKHLLDANRKTISSLEGDKLSLAEQKKSLERKVDTLQKDVESFQRKEGTTVKPQPASGGDLTTIRLQRELKQLQQHNETCVSRLEEAMISLEQEKLKCRELERKLSTTEEKWELVVKRYRDNERQLNSKLDTLSDELNGSKTQLSTSQLEVLRLQAENKRVLNSSLTEKDKAREQLHLEQSLLNKEVERHRETIGELEGLVEGLKKDRDVLAHELQVMISKEQKHKEWAGSLELAERENRELRDKVRLTFASSRTTSPSPAIQALESSLGKHNFLEQELELEKRKVKEVAKQKLQTAEQTAEGLQEQLGRKSVELFRQAGSAREGQSKMESELQTLKTELEREKALASRDKVDLNRSLDREERRIQDLHEQIQSKNEEILHLRREVGQLSLDSSKSDEKVQEETRRRGDIESRNKVLEEEMTKLWGQMKSMMDRLSEAEKGKQDAEAELTRLTNQYRHQEAAKDLHQAETMAVTTTLSKVQQRAQAAERKIPELQSDLDQTVLRLQATESQLKEYGALKVELQDRRDEVTRLKALGQDDKMQKSVMSQQIEDLRLQLKTGRALEDQLRKENVELKDQLLEIQARLAQAEDTSRNVSDKHNMAEQSRSSLLQQLGNLQGENENLRQELLRVSNQLDAQLRKYQDHKNNTKTKLQQAREIFNKQKSMLTDSLMKLQEELNMTKTELQKSGDDRSNMDNKHQTLLSEHREVLSKMAELEELVRDQSRDIGTQDYRVKFLERENAMLQERIDTLSKQRMALEKLVREYRLEKQKDDINRSIGGVPSTPGFGMISQPLGSSMGYMPSKTSPSSGVGNSLSNLSTADLPNGHHDSLLVKTGQTSGLDLHPSVGLPLQSPSSTFISNNGSI
ncbi:uncharacterized protein [Diadema setosum]|uniref:uncharacterized protein n=1 Tax=Diadema setosum TaxID=31175 RepID=UPI003B3A5AC7